MRCSLALLGRAALVSAVGLLLLAAPVPAAQNPVEATVKTSAQRLSVGETLEVELVVEIAEGWHINSNDPEQEFLIPTEVSFQLPAGLEVDGVVYPPPIRKQLRFGGVKQLRLFEGRTVVAAKLRYSELANIRAAPELLLRYQACNETLCLPPQTVRIPLHVKLSLVEGLAYAGVNEESADYVADLLSRGWWAVIPVMLLSGLALNLTPCVYPLVSVTLAYFGGQASNDESRKLGLAVAYAAGIVVTFSALGVVAALAGGLFGGALAHPAVNVGIALLMFVLALSSFGVYQLRLPAGVVARAGGSFGGVLGALFMGLTMGLVAAPCVGPFVVGMLLVVGSRGDIVLGVQLFSLLALGLGLPYVVLAVAAGSIANLPRSGDWLQWVEHLFGFVLVGLGLFFLQPILPESVERLLMPLFLLGAISYLAFLDPAGSGSRGFVRSRVALGVVALAFVAVEFVPRPGGGPALAWEPFSSDRFLAVRESGSPFVIEFGAEWCLPCKEMEERTFTDPRVLREAQGVALLEVDMTTTTDQVSRVLRSFEVLGAPTTVFFGPGGEEVTRRIGFVGPEEFAELLRRSRGEPGRPPPSGASPS